MIRTPKYYADTLNDPFVMEDEKCARIMEAAEDYFHLRYFPPQVLSTSDTFPLRYFPPQILASWMQITN